MKAEIATIETSIASYNTKQDELYIKVSNLQKEEQTLTVQNAPLNAQLADLGHMEYEWENIKLQKETEEKMETLISETSFEETTFSDSFDSWSDDFSFEF